MPSGVTEPSPRAPSAADPKVPTGEDGDIMLGMSKITAFLRVLFDDPDLEESKAYVWFAKGYLPGGKLGSLTIASKITIREHLQRPTNLRAAAPATRPELDSAGSRRASGRRAPVPSRAHRRRPAARVSP